MRPWLLIIFGMTISVLIVLALFFSKHLITPQPSESPKSSLSSFHGKLLTLAPTPIPSISEVPDSEPSPTASPDLGISSNGLSHATVLLKTTQGPIKFKFYPKDAPKTVSRLIELIQNGFYNGLQFHRVVPGFVIQSGDPLGNGTGGSGQKLDAEFNNRHHIEGTVAMARTGDPNSADSQFYISLGKLPHLDHQYTIFGQVVEGMDNAKRIKVGDKILSVIIQ